jgi:hypothetical protein
MPWTACPKTQRLEDLHELLAEEWSDPMRDNNDWPESIRRGDPEPINHDLEEMGFFFDPATKKLVWEDSFGSDPESAWCKAIEAKIEKDDRAFLTACGILAEDL